MKYTLLEMVQEILSGMDSDEVDSITDTTEAMQVARIVRQAYYDLIEDLDPPERYTLFELTASGSNSKPVLMTMPTDMNSLLWVKYNKITADGTTPLFEPVTFQPMDQFLSRMYSLDTGNSNVDTFEQTVNSDTVTILYTNDRAPQFYTTLGDDVTLIFDSYDSEVDTTLQKNKTLCYGMKTQTLALSDNVTPVLDEPYFVRLLNEAKILAFAELKSVQHAVADRNARRSRSRAQKKKFRVQRESDFDQLPNYSRNR